MSSLNQTDNVYQILDYHIFHLVNRHNQMKYFEKRMEYLMARRQIQLMNLHLKIQTINEHLSSLNSK